MEPHVEQCIETTSNPLSDRLVGIADVSEHEVTDKSGGKTRRLVADLMIFDPATSVERREKVAPGEIVAIGADEYCVVDAREGKGDERGTVSLQKISK